MPQSPRHLLATRVALFGLLLVGAGAPAGLGACGGGDDPAPTEVKFGDTALVVVLNPVVNDANDSTVPTIGTVRAGVKLTSDDGISATTSAKGIAVLAPLTPGTRTITLSGGGTSGTFQVTMVDGQLREVAVASSGAAPVVITSLDYKSDTVVEINPSMAIADVNAALAVSDRVVFLQGGVYTGDLDFSGSRVTLFGEGVLGGEVQITGNVTVSGSDSRIRGATITGNLTVPASGVGLTFSRVNGTVTAEGSDATFLANALCGASETITGSGSVVLDNTGLAPTATCP